MDKVYTPQIIQENPLPSAAGVVSTTTTQPGSATTQQYAPATIQETPVPTPKIATELLSDNLNTRTKKILNQFTFSPSGALQIGDYKNGDSGDIRISPDGIVARDKFGNQTFALDGNDGSAVFAGEIQAGTFVSGQVIVGDGSVVIDGEANKIDIYDDNEKNLIRLDNTGLIGFSTTSEEVMHLKTTGLELYGEAGNIFILKDSAAGTTWGKLGYSISAGFAHSIDLSARGVMYLTAYESDGDFSVLKAYLQLNDGSDLGDSVLFSKNDFNVNTGGVFKVNGATKTAIVPTSKGHKALYTVESPEVWFFDFAKDKASIDPLFLEVTEGKSKTIKTQEGELLIFRKRKGYKAIRFENRSLEQFERNNNFWNLPL